MTMVSDAAEAAPAPPLDGFRVLDLTQIVAGPFCTTMLADLGAEVVKIERPGSGDDTRHLGPFPGREGHQDFFYALNRSKRSVGLDLKKAEHLQVARDLAARADILVENFAPGTAERLGMGYADLQPLNPRLVYCSISGFGQTGPYRDRLAVDPIIQSVTGLMNATGFADGAPVIVGAPVTDVISGMFAAFAIVGALIAAKRDKRGQYIDVAMQAAMIAAAAGPRLADALQSNRAAGRLGNENPLRVPSDAYETADGRFISITVVSDRHWAPFCRAMGCLEWISDTRFSTMRERVKHRMALQSMVTARFREAMLAEWTTRLAAERVAFAPVNDFVEALGDEQVAYRGLVHEVKHPVSGILRLIGPPWTTSFPAAKIAAPPLLGEHIAEVLRDWLSWDDARIASFQGSC